MAPEISANGGDFGGDSVAEAKGLASPDADSVSGLMGRFYSLFPEAKPRAARDAAYFSVLIADFGKTVDLEEELMLYAAWILDRGAGFVKSPRSGLRLWLKRGANNRRAGA